MGRMWRVRRLVLAACVVALTSGFWGAAPAHADNYGPGGTPYGDLIPAAPDNKGLLPPDWKQTQWGAYSPADQALLENVRRADLWEGITAAQLGQQKGTTQRIKDVGKALGEQHAKLEAAVKDLQGKLDVTLPTEPNDEQKSWIAEMRNAQGQQFDQVWVDRLRFAHGKIYSLLATVRANTRNSLMRDFAQTGVNVVSVHMALLESTGLVKFNLGPTPAAPAATGAASTLTSIGGPSTPFIWVILAIGLLGCVAVGIRTFRTR
jgi:predicted outer membrane protein